MANLNILVSYYYLQRGNSFTDSVLAIAPYVRILVDSGAFSAFNAKTKKNPDPEIRTYIEACKKYSREGVWQYIALDVVRDPRTSKRNLLSMVDAGLKPMPVFVYPQNYDEVEELVNINEHLCVAGGVDGEDQFLIQRYQRVFQRSGQKAKIHALGFTRYGLFEKLPLWSVDSSTWTSGSRFGSLYVWYNGVPRKISDKKHKERTFIQRYLRNFNISAATMKSDLMHSKLHGVHSLLTAFAFMRFAERSNTEFGVQYFLACPNINWLQALIAVSATRTGEFFDYEACFDLYDRLRYAPADKKATMLQDIAKGL